MERRGHRKNIRGSFVPGTDVTYPHSMFLTAEIRKIVADDDLVVKTTAAELLNALINRRSKAGLQDNTRLLRYGISKRTRFDPDDSGNYYNY